MNMRRGIGKYRPSGLLSDEVYCNIPSSRNNTTSTNLCDLPNAKRQKSHHILPSSSPHDDVGYTSKHEDGRQSSVELGLPMEYVGGYYYSSSSAREEDVVCGVLSDEAACLSDCGVSSSSASASSASECSGSQDMSSLKESGSSSCDELYDDRGVCYGSPSRKQQSIMMMGGHRHHHHSSSNSHHRGSSSQHPVSSEKHLVGYQYRNKLLRTIEGIYEVATDKSICKMISRMFKQKLDVVPQSAVELLKFFVPQHQKNISEIHVLTELCETLRSKLSVSASQLRQALSQMGEWQSNPPIPSHLVILKTIQSIEKRMILTSLLLIRFIDCSSACTSLTPLLLSLPSWHVPAQWRSISFSQCPLAGAFSHIPVACESCHLPIVLLYNLGLSKDYLRFTLNYWCNHTNNSKLLLRHLYLIRPDFLIIYILKQLCTIVLESYGLQEIPPDPSDSSFYSSTMGTPTPEAAESVLCSPFSLNKTGAQLVEYLADVTGDCVSMYCLVVAVLNLIFRVSVSPKGFDEAASPLKPSCSSGFNGYNASRGYQETSATAPQYSGVPGDVVEFVSHLSTLFSITLESPTSQVPLLWDLNTSSSSAEVDFSTVLQICNFLFGSSGSHGLYSVSCAGCIVSVRVAFYSLCAKIGALDVSKVEFSNSASLLSRLSETGLVSMQAMSSSSSRQRVKNELITSYFTEIFPYLVVCKSYEVEAHNPAPLDRVAASSSTTNSKASVLQLLHHKHDMLDVTYESFIDLLIILCYPPLLHCLVQCWLACVTACECDEQVTLKEDSEKKSRDAALMEMGFLLCVSSRYLVGRAKLKSFRAFLCLSNLFDCLTQQLEEEAHLSQTFPRSIWSISVPLSASYVDEFELNTYRETSDMPPSMKTLHVKIPSAGNQMTLCHLMRCFAKSPPFVPRISDELMYLLAPLGVSRHGFCPTITNCTHKCAEDFRESVANQCGGGSLLCSFLKSVNALDRVLSAANVDYGVIRQCLSKMHESHKLINTCSGFGEYGQNSPFVSFIIIRGMRQIYASLLMSTSILLLHCSTTGSRQFSRPTDFHFSSPSTATLLHEFLMYEMLSGNFRHMFDDHEYLSMIFRTSYLLILILCDPKCTKNKSVFRFYSRMPKIVAKITSQVLESCLPEFPNLSYLIGTLLSIDLVFKNRAAFSPDQIDKFFLFFSFAANTTISPHSVRSGLSFLCGIKSLVYFNPFLRIMSFFDDQVDPIQAWLSTDITLNRDKRGAGGFPPSIDPPSSDSIIQELYSSNPGLLEAIETCRKEMAETTLLRLSFLCHRTLHSYVQRLRLQQLLDIKQ